MDERTLNELLECSVCLDRLDASSKVLPCQHTFCRRCLEEIVTSQKELRCPECRTLVDIKIEDLPTNILLIRLLEGLKTVAASTSASLPTPISCGYSSNPAHKSSRPTALRHATAQPCAKALYNYDAKEPGDLTFRKGDVVLLHKQVDENWFYGQLKNQRGFFPATYVQVLHALPQKDAPPQCTARYDFVIHDENEKDCLSFKKDEVLTVIRRVDENWAEGKLRNKIGIFPISFVDMNSAAKSLMARPVLEPRTPFLGSPPGWRMIGENEGASHREGRPAVCPQALALSLVNGSVPTSFTGLLNSSNGVPKSSTSTTTSESLGAQSPTGNLVTTSSLSPSTAPVSSSSGSNATTSGSTATTGEVAVVTSSSSGLSVPQRHHKRYSLSALACQRLGLVPASSNRHSMEISGMLPKDGTDPTASSSQEVSGSCTTAVLTLVTSSLATVSSIAPVSNCTVVSSGLASSRSTATSASAAAGASTGAREGASASPADVSVSVQTSLTTTAVTGSESSPAVVRNGGNFPGIFRAMYNYKPQKSDELELTRGDYYTVVERCLDGWFKGASLRTGVRGVFPGNYMQAIELEHSPRCSVANRARNLLRSPQGLVVGGVATVPGLRHSVNRTQSFPKTSPLAAHGHEQRSRKNTGANGQHSRRAAIVNNSASCDSPNVPQTSDSVSRPSVTAASSTFQSMSHSSCTPVQHVGTDHIEISALSLSTPPPSSSAQTVSPKVPRRHLRRLKGAASLPHEHHKPRAPTPPAENDERGAVGGAVDVDTNVVSASSTTQQTEAGKHSSNSSKGKKDKDRLSIMKRLASAGLPLRGRKARSPPAADGSRPRTHPTHQRSGSDSSLFENTTSCLPNSFRHHENRPPKVKPLTREKYRCVVPYPPQTDQEIELREGDLVYVHKKREDGWYKGTHCRSGKSGLFPGSFVEKHKE